MPELQLFTPNDRELVMTRSFAAPMELVFACHTRPELVRRWLLGPPGWTMPLCEIDARVGGAYRFRWRGPDGETMSASGVHREVVAPERLVFTQLFDEDWTGGETLITVTLRDMAGHTELTQTTLFASAEARKAALDTGMTEGMESSFQQLDALLATEGEITRER
ncbi:MAG TPA: SRPBCC family protein [Devosiaceae bacterium]|jgi:uncharacterized protein YndB with AHSA1/START domain|nr:SRPBCC family protein [Devosiaceae bacterium]